MKGAQQVVVCFVRQALGQGAGQVGSGASAAPCLPGEEGGKLVLLRHLVGALGGVSRQGGAPAAVALAILFRLLRLSWSGRAH